LRLKILKKLRTTSLNSKFTGSYKKSVAGLHDQSKNSFFRGPAFIQAIRAI